MSTPDQLVDVPLTTDERRLLVCGLTEWGGPAYCTDDLARVIGFADVKALLRDGYALAAQIDRVEPLTLRDWRRAQIATEFVFASSVFGSGHDWSITTGLQDTETIVLLRSVQRKLLNVFAIAGVELRAPPGD